MLSIAALPDRLEGDEQCVQILEASYADMAAAQELQARMKSDALFRKKMNSTMTNKKYRKRLKAAIDASPFIKSSPLDASSDLESNALEKGMEAMKSNPLLQSLMGNKDAMKQLKELQGSPGKMKAMMSDSEGRLKAIAQQQADGVQAYYDDFQPGADDLIAKFSAIAEKGYPAFMTIAGDDARVKNAIINALMDEAQQASTPRGPLPLDAKIAELKKKKESGGAGSKFAARKAAENAKKL